MNLDDLTVGELKQITKLAAGLNGAPVCRDQEQHWSVGKFCLIRTYSAGVHFGVVESCVGTGDAYEVTLTNSQRIWSWTGANTLNEIANTGVGSGSKVSEPTERVGLVAIEVIDANKGEKALRGAKWGK